MRLISSLLVSLLLCAVTTRAQADTVVLLGLRSVEGDDDFGNDLTQALRRQLARLPSMQLSDRAVSLSQMSMAYGCEEPDAACLTDIAAGLQTQSVVYGTLRRSSTRADYQYSLSLSFFSSERGSIENTVTRNIPQQDPNLDAQAEAALSTLLGLQSDAGGIVVHVNVPAAEVTVNGQSVGTTVDGELRLSGLAPGRYQVVVAAPDMPRYTTTVRVSASQDEPSEAAPAAASYELDTEGRDAASDDGSFNRYLGYSLLGVAALGLVGTIYSWSTISSINGDADFKAYRTRVGMSADANQIGDVCASNNAYAAPNSPEYATFRDKIRGQCSDAGLFETLQWVFLGTAVAAGGAGTYFLLTAGGDDDSNEHAAATPVFTVQPRLSRGTQALEATFHF
jgi:hypothetical protein